MCEKYGWKNIFSFGSHQTFYLAGTQLVSWTRATSSSPRVRVSVRLSSSSEILIMSSSEVIRAKARSRVADMKPQLLLKYLPLNSGYSQYFAQLAMLKWTIVKTCCRISTFIQWHNLLHKAQATFNLETVLLHYIYNSRSFLKPQNQ